MPGWTAAAWAADCRRRALACVKWRPDLAEQWLEWGLAVALRGDGISDLKSEISDTGARCAPVRWASAAETDELGRLTDGPPW